MQIFTFKAYDKTFKAKAEKGLDVMEKANKELLWSNPKAKEGAWFPNIKLNSYTWVEGNFFD
tara:strand:- start:150 stop:335 length:186 start_codon:yes stop_codon:yes gene_type:complete